MFATDDDLDAALREHFGLPAFRPWQREAVRAVLSSPHRALVVAPTGGGKSLTYQFPAVVLPGTTLVVSPLIALMEDQVRGLLARGIPATYLASNLDASERRARLAALRRGEFKLVYVAPERLAIEGLLESLRELAPPLVAIDEAHCISQWGHDFRPDYLALGRVLDALKPPRILACTATATPDVRTEILARLHLEPSSTRVILRGFARPNLHLASFEVEGATERKKHVLGELRNGIPKKSSGAGIVYVATRRAAEDYGALVGGAGLRTGVYHAGLESAERSRVSHAFAQGELDVVVATNAFGMGIDRPDVRTVVHVHPPGSLEAYYQEVGRAGRDGKPCRGVLLSATSDIALRRMLIAKDGAPQAIIERQWSMFLDLLRYIEAGSCRHDFVLRYFDDTEETLGGCGHCDVCARLDEQGDGERRVSDDDALLVRKALAGVARANRRVGLRAIADMLGGERSSRQKQLGLDRLTTHGLLREHSNAWIVSLLRRCITAGLVDVTASEMPLVFLTGLGVRTMRGEEPVRVLIPERVRAPRAAPRIAPSTGHGPLFEALRAARLELAQSQGLPAYVICNDRSLVELAARRPREVAELRGIPGLGPARIAAYGTRLLEVVARASSSR